MSATVIWEDRDRPHQDIYFETTAEFASDLSCNPHAFLLACIIPALHYGEKRLALDAPICPELREGLVTAMSLIRHWYGYNRPLVKIEAPLQSHPPTRSTPPRTAFFYTGGIDSLANLRVNRLNFPLSHPLSIKDGLLVYGLQDTTRENFEKIVNSLTALAQEAQIQLIPVYTNISSHIRDLEYIEGKYNYDWRFWIFEFIGSALAAVAHAFSSRLTTVSISSSDDIPQLAPLGSHPLLDPNYSSYDLQIRHDGISLSRLAKTKIVADWDLALAHLRVCDWQKLPPGLFNCGQCEKCLRTMTALVALGALEKTRVFPQTDVSQDLLLAGVNIDGLDVEASYLELIPLLNQKGRQDLVRAIQHLSTRYREKDWKGWLKRFDRTIFKGNLRHLIKK